MSTENFEDLKTNIEAILFSFGDWISVNQIMQTLNVDSELLVSNSLKELKKKYESGFPFHVESDEQNRWRMNLKDKYEEIISELISGFEIPHNVLKVLSVIAYEQPITKTRLGEILGRSVKQEVNYLYKNSFLSYEKHGIGKYYRVTKKFYDYFKLEEGEDFRTQANKNINTFLKESEELISDDT